MSFSAKPLTTGNSGVFIRTDKPTDNVETGLEIQIERPAKWWAPDKHSCGALYDALAPTKEASKKDGWNHLVIIARGPKIAVVMNDEPIIDADLDRWTEAGKNPDGNQEQVSRRPQGLQARGPHWLAGPRRRCEVPQHQDQAAGQRKREVSPALTSVLRLRDDQARPVHRRGAPILEAMQDETYREIAEALTDRRIKTPRGGDVWNQVTVMRVMRRLGIAGK